MKDRNLTIMNFILNCTFLSALLLICLKFSNSMNQTHDGSSLLLLWENYKEHPVLDRWDQFAYGYERHIPKPGKKLKLLEIGVQSGGSARAWKQYYGSDLYYTGVDINPGSFRTNSPDENIYIEIGSQGDENFMNSICRKHGPFDVIIDDGAHSTDMIRASLKILFPNNLCMTTHSVYVLEDTCTMMSAGFVHQSPREIADIAAEAWLSMHNYWLTEKSLSSMIRCQNKNCDMKPFGGSDMDPIYKNLLTAVNLYDGIAFFQRGVRKPLKRVKRGDDMIEYFVKKNSPKVNKMHPKNANNLS